LKRGVFFAGLTLLPLNSQPTDHSQWFHDEVQPHEPALRGYLRSLFPSLPDLDDLVQESYARLLRAKEAGKVKYVKAFLFAIARNAALDFCRRRKVVSFESIGDLVDLTVIDERPDVAEALNKQQELDLLADAVRTLPERCRQVLTLRLLYGLSHKEIAAELGISDLTVKAQLAKGMRRCADYFQVRGLVKGRPIVPKN
jgi:RNA polymerase sigma factor (sigma-70 family)